MTTYENWYAYPQTLRHGKVADTTQLPSDFSLVKTLSLKT